MNKVTRLQVGMNERAISEVAVRRIQARLLLGKPLGEGEKAVLDAVISKFCLDAKWVTPDCVEADQISYGELLVNQPAIPRPAATLICP